MFADGSKVPYDRTRRLIEKLAAPLKATPLRVSIIGHTAAGFVPTPKRLWRVRSVGGSGQRGAPDSRAGRTAAGAYLCGLRQGRHPAAVSRRSLAVGEPPRDHHADARRSAAAARSEAVAGLALLLYQGCCITAAAARRFAATSGVVGRCYGSSADGLSGSVDKPPRLRSIVQSICSQPWFSALASYRSVKDGRGHIRLQGADDRKHRCRLRRHRDQAALRVYARLWWRPRKAGRSPVSWCSALSR